MTQIKGGPELLAFLDQFPEKIVRNVVRGALRAGAKVVHEQARVNVPAKSGRLRKAIKFGSRTEAGQAIGYVRVSKYQGYVAHWVEYGTAAHIIKVNTRAGEKALSPRKATAAALHFGTTFADAVWHPGATPKPFMRPALDTKATEAINAVGAYIANRMRIGDLNAPTLSAEDEE